MGAVYPATDTKLNREVAVKILPGAFASDPDRLARFTREAQVRAPLNHPNIAAINGVEDRVLVMELVEGEKLKGPLPLETAHGKGIVHCDLKPPTSRSRRMAASKSSTSASPEPCRERWRHPTRLTPRPTSKAGDHGG